MRVSSWYQSRLIYDFDSERDMHRFINYMEVFEKFSLIKHIPYYIDDNIVRIIFDEKEFDYL